jgi:hypothetical protein
MAPGIRVLLTIADLDRLAPPPCMNACPVCGSDQVHGQACVATRLSDVYPNFITPILMNHLLHT